MEKYNGWANRSTWLVDVWFGDYFQQIIKEDKQSLDAGKLKSLVMETMPDNVSGFWSDVLYLMDVNYHELAEHYIWEGDKR